MQKTLLTYTYKFLIYGLTALTLIIVLQSPKWINNARAQDFGKQLDAVDVLVLAQNPFARILAKDTSVYGGTGSADDCYYSATHVYSVFAKDVESLKAQILAKKFNPLQERADGKDAYLQVVGSEGILTVNIEDGGFVTISTALDKRCG